jgi:hypothetical protein
MTTLNGGQHRNSLSLINGITPQAPSGWKRTLRKENNEEAAVQQQQDCNSKNLPLEACHSLVFCCCIWCTYRCVGLCGILLTYPPSLQLCLFATAILLSTKVTVAETTSKPRHPWSQGDKWEKFFKPVGRLTQTCECRSCDGSKIFDWATTAAWEEATEKNFLRSHTWTGDFNKSTISRTKFFFSWFNSTEILRSWSGGIRDILTQLTIIQTKKISGGIYALL